MITLTQEQLDLDIPQAAIAKATQLQRHIEVKGEFAMLDIKRPRFGWGRYATSYDQQMKLYSSTNIFSIFFSQKAICF
ncbi:hypothetical protein SPLC1_S260060 [Arthrospira platensis C1]|nr:hypothetical protein SPLC1_S260060 [Arthrospira platensis C1]